MEHEEKQGEVNREKGQKDQPSEALPAAEPAAVERVTAKNRRRLLANRRPANQ